MLGISRARVSQLRALYPDLRPDGADGAAPFELADRPRVLSRRAQAEAKRGLEELQAAALRLSPEQFCCVYWSTSPGPEGLPADYPRPQGRVDGSPTRRYPKPMRTVSFPPFDRDRVATMVKGRKSNLLAALPDDPAGVAAVVRTFFRHLAPIATERFGEPAALILGICTIRHHKPGDAEHAPRHVDANFFPPTGFGLTFWCPLDVIGETSPGVTFFTEDGEVTPKVGPGSALVVPPTLPHQTQALDGERLSVEFRCAPMRRLPINVGESRIAIVAPIEGVPRLLIAPAPQLIRDGLCALVGSSGQRSSTAAGPC